MKESKEKNKVEKIAKLISDILSEEFSFLILLLSCLIAPVVWDFSIVHWIWKIIMIICSMIGLSVLIFLFVDLNYSKNSRLLYSYIPLSILFILSIVSYFDFEVYGIKTFIIGLLIIYVVFIGIYNLLNLFLKRVFLYEKFLIILSSFMLFSYWIAWVIKTSENIKLSQTFLILGTVLLYLIIIYMIINRYLYSSKPLGMGRKIIGIIFWSGIVIFSFPYFIQWCGVTGEKFNTFLSVYSATIGGGLTLIGVAWTIKKNNDDRKNDRLQSNKPLIYPVASQSEYNYRQQVELVFYNKDETKEYTFIGIIKNTDKAILIVEKAIINDIEYEMKYPVVLDKNIPGEVIVYDKTKLEIYSMYIIGKDVLGNNLKYKIVVNQEKRNIEAIYEE